MRKKIGILTILISFLLLTISTNTLKAINLSESENNENIIQGEKLACFFSTFEEIKKEYSYEDSPELYNAITKSTIKDKDGNTIAFDLQIFEQELEKASKTTPNYIGHWRFFMKNAQILIESVGQYTLSDREGFFKYEFYSEDYGLAIIDYASHRPILGYCNIIYTQGASLRYGYYTWLDYTLAHGTNLPVNEEKDSRSIKDNINTEMLSRFPISEKILQQLNQIEKKSPVVKSQSDVATITVTGGNKIKITVKENVPNTIVNKGYYWRVEITFDGGLTFSPSFNGYIDSSTESCSTYSLLYMRFWYKDCLNRRSGTVHVKVTIRDGNPGDVVQTLEKTGSFSFSRVTF
jgi:hypothetical protein